MHQNTRKLTRQRIELLFALAHKDLKVRYKSTLLGFLWSLLVPISLMLVFMLVFSFIMKFNITPTFLLAGLFPWTFFSFTVASVVTNFVDNGNLIKKVSLPRELLPASVVIANFFNFALSMVILLFFDIQWTPFLLAIPAVMVLQFLFTLGLAFIVSAAHVYFRDTRYIVEIGLLLWFYLTPIFYPLDFVQSISKKLLYLFLLNPMAGLTVMYRDLLINGMLSSFELITTTVALCVIVFLAGYLVFQKLKANLSDYV